jgi:hypothetical protein
MALVLRGSMMRKIGKAAFFSLMLLTIAFNCFASNWESKAKQAFSLDEYQKCIDIINGVKGDTDSLHRSMFLAFSNLQLYQYTKSKEYQAQYQTHLKAVESRAQVSDLSKILYFVNLIDKPEVVKSSRSLARKILRDMYKIEEVPLLIPFAESSDKQVRGLSYDAMRRIFKIKRDVVNKGGNLRAQDMKVMSDPNLIKILLKNANDQKAANVLLLIEEPVLKHAEPISDIQVAKVQERIVKAIAKRQKSYPSSNWHSATGQVR